MLLGNGDGTFQHAQTTNAVGVEPYAIASGDFNGDGRTDLAVVNYADRNVSVLLGNGDGTFQPQVTYAVGSFPYAIVTGDFNGDGRTDLAVANYGDKTVSVLLGNGDGTFQPQVTYAVAESPVSIVAGDFTGNGRIDLAASGWSVNTLDEQTDGPVSVLLGNGDGTFQPANTITGVGRLSSGRRLQWRRPHRPGRPRLQRQCPWLPVGAAGQGRRHVPAPGHLRGWAEYTTVSWRATSTATAASTWLSPARASVTSPTRPRANLRCSWATAMARSSPRSPTRSGRFATAIVAGDFTGDGRIDLAVGTPRDGAQMFLGNGDGTFQPATTLEAPATWPAHRLSGGWRLQRRRPHRSRHSGSTVSVLLNKGDGTFTAPGQIATTTHATPLVADVNGDGTKDVLVIDSAGNILYRQGVPGQPGSFEPPVTVNPGNPSRDIAWIADAGQVPLLASVDAHDNAITLYSYGDHGFVQAGSLATGLLPAQIIAADLNGNGLTDLVVRNAGDGTLSVFYRVYWRFGPPQYWPAITIPVGLGVSDVQAVDTTGGGRLDLVFTNKLTGQLSILPNLGDGTFGPPEPYRAGIGLSAIDATSSPAVTSLEATGGVAAAPLTPGGATDLVTINTGSNTLGVLAGLGGGRFANPETILTPYSAQVIRIADLNHDGIPDLVLLGTNRVTILLGDGHGGFQTPVSYDAGFEPSGLTVADINGDGIPDLLIGNVYGDLLILQGNGDGTFRPYRKADQSVALAVADLTGNGQPDFIYADQGLDRVVVQYGTSQTTVLGDQATGLLAPGAVTLADLNGDGIPDLIVANSGSNNVLVYPGLGNGQFGPALNGGHGFFVGTNPTGITVANLNGQPDLIVANSGSNNVSVLLGQGTGSNFTLIPGPRISTDAGPVAVAVGNILGTGQQDLAVANQQANNVQVFPGVGGGFFNDQPQAVKTYAVGQAPSGLFLGRFSGSGTGIAALNAGSNTVTLIGPAGVEQTVAAGGLRPSAGFAGDFTGNGFTDLVVGNTADGRIALFTGGADGLNLSQSITSAEVPSPTSLSFAGVTDGVLSFYAATAGRESASLLSFNLDTQETSSAVGELSGGELAGGTGQSIGSVLTATTTGVFQQAAQLLGLNGSALDLIAPLLTVSVVPGNFDTGAHGDAEIALLANFLPSTTTTVPQRPGLPQNPGGPAGQTTEKAPDKPENPEEAEADLPIWAQLASGLERAWEQLRTRMLQREGIDPEAADQAVSASSHKSKAPEQAPGGQGQAQPLPGRSQTGLAPPLEVPQQNSQPGKQTFLDVIDAAIAELAEGTLGVYRGEDLHMADQDGEATITQDRLAQSLAASISLASMEGLARWIRRTQARQRMRGAFAALRCHKQLRIPFAGASGLYRVTSTYHKPEAPAKDG